MVSGSRDHHPHFPFSKEFDATQKSVSSQLTCLQVVSSEPLNHLSIPYAFEEVVAEKVAVVFSPSRYFGY